MDLDVLAEELNRLALDEDSRSHPGRLPIATETLRQYSQAFIAASEHRRTAVRSSLTSDARRLLLNFAWDSAELAVEKKSPELVAVGLLAVAIEGGDIDIGASTARIAVLYRSARKLGLNTEAIFRQAAEWACSPQLAAAMQSFPLRSEEQLDLNKAFFIQEIDSEGRFRYVQRSLPVNHSVWREKLRTLFGRQRLPT